ncbi:MAG: hypothetical protein EXS10_04030 [Phycisphaerales bacterium]|nr:hypothetical protein [Phycisphaerales bacterium]
MRCSHAQEVPISLLGESMDATPQSGEVKRSASARTDVLALIDEMERSVSTLRAVQDAMDDARSSTISLADERDALLESSLAAQARIAHLSCEREEFRSAMEIARAECESLRASYDSLAIAGGASDEASASLQSILDQKETLLYEMRESLARAEANVADYESRVAGARRESETRMREAESAQTSLRLATERLGVLAKHTVEQARKIAELQGLLAAAGTSSATTDNSARDAERASFEKKLAEAAEALRAERERARTSETGDADTSLAMAELLALRGELALRAKFLEHRRETLRKYRVALRARRGEWSAREAEIGRAVERKINEVRDEARSDARRDADQRVREAVAEMQRGGGVPSVTMEEFQRRVREEEERQERDRLELSESRRLLSECEHELVRRYSAARGGTVLALSCIGIALCAWNAWWLSGELAPTTEIATVDLAVTSRSGDASVREEANPAPIIALLERAPADPAFHAAVGTRLQDRGFTPGEALAETKLFAEHFKIDASNGAFVHLMYTGDARARIVLDTATTTLVQEANKAPERKQDFLRVSIAGMRQDSGRVVFSEARAMPDPGRSLRAASIFGIGFGVAMCIGFGGWAFARRVPKTMDAMD